MTPKTAQTGVRISRFVVGLVVFLAALAGVLGYTVRDTPFFRRPNSPFPYSAAIPGPGKQCDRGGAKWTTVSGHVLCRTDRMELSTGSTQTLGEVAFYGSVRLPTDNQVSVDIDGLTTGSCAGVITRDANTRKGGYAFEICWDGRWIIGKYDVADTFYSLNSGAIAQANAYHLACSTQGVSLRLAINGANAGIAADGTFTETDAVSLFVNPIAQGTSVADFHNFTFAQVA